MNKMAKPKAHVDEKENNSHARGICLEAQHLFGNRQFIQKRQLNLLSN